MNTLERKCSYCDGVGTTGPSGDPPEICARCSGTGREFFGNLNTADLNSQMVDCISTISGYGDKNLDVSNKILEVCEKILANLPKQ